MKDMGMGLKPAEPAGLQTGDPMLGSYRNVLFCPLSDPEPEAYRKTPLGTGRTGPPHIACENQCRHPHVRVEGMPGDVVMGLE